jgi:SAM-dependent methyltransferase/SOS-response transcriptional repressor LexA
MDARTLQVYSSDASLFARSYTKVKSEASALFAMAFPPGSRVLDVGCGAGRDLDALVQAGYDGMGVDASPEMLAEAKGHYPALAGRVTTDSLPALSTIEDASWEGVLCWSVLMHLPEELLFDTVFNLRRILKQGGRMLISTPLEGPSVNPETHRDEQGRLFNGVAPEKFRFLFEKVGFRLLNRWDEKDSLGRAGRRWATQLLVLEGEGSRSLDKVQGILTRDKKDATYKPALFRALAELATTSYHAAAWLPEGRVAIPLKLIADKWLEYFWPLFESETFIPQKRGEKPGCLKPVAFRAELERLIELYRGMGGLCGFTVANRGNTLSLKAAGLYVKVRSRLCDTIRNGPVYFSGGGGSGTFEYDKLSQSVVMDADLWRELSIMGSWIADATILRWAELTEEISQGDLRASQVIDQLLTVPIPEREVQAARSLYEGLAGKVCVWTDRGLVNGFDVDHAIPFALWRNNDLWNLLPASPAVNNQKRDRLPSRSLVLKRKDCMIHYWTLMRDHHPERFAFEVGRLAGVEVARADNWENRLFGAVAEALEFTAVQSGVERWEPAERGSARRSPAAGASCPVERGEDEAEHGPRVRVVEDPPARERFVFYVPFYEVAAAAGAFGPDQPAVDSQEHRPWVRVDGFRLTSEMFAIRVKGRSMEPKIPDGSICLFRGGSALAGSRQSRDVLVALRDSVDPETGGRLTVKRYFSEKVEDASGSFRHNRIVLKPLNPEFEPIVIENAEEGLLCVVGELMGVIGQG